MQETFERVTERRGKVEAPIKHLYRRQYQTAGGDWRTIYYAIFTDWKGKRPKFSHGGVIFLGVDGSIDRHKSNVGISAHWHSDCFLFIIKIKSGLIKSGSALMQIREVMTQGPAIINSNATAVEAAAKMKELDVGSPAGV
jgi:hypothetical protein